MKNRRNIFIGLLAILAVVCVMLLTSLTQKEDSRTIHISGLEKCSKEIDGKRVSAVGRDLYGYVKAANDYVKTKSSASYEGRVREGSCGKTTSNLTRDYNGDKNKVYTSRALIDIPAAKQSWQVQYDWMPNQNEGVDLGTLTATCPALDVLKYGDFQCQKALNVFEHGTANYDPIMEYMPYIGEGFNMDYNPDTKQVTATLVIPASQKGNQELVENNKAVIPYWFQKRGLDQNKYTIVYTAIYQ